MPLLETSFVIDVLRNKDTAVAFLKKLEQEEPRLFIASPTVMELWEGALKSRGPAHEKQKIEALLFTANILPFDLRAAKQTAEFLVVLAQQGLSIQLPDVMIAATAVTNGEKLVTADAHYKRISELGVINY